MRRSDSTTRPTTNAFRAVPALAVPALAVLVLSGAAIAEDAPTLSELRAAVDETLASMPALEVQYTVRNEPHEEPDEQASPELKEYVSPWGPKQYLWAKSGRSGSLSSEYASGRYQWIVSYDGDKGYNSFSPLGQATITVTPGVPEAYASKERLDCLIGLGVPMGDATLGEALRSPTATSAGTETIDGSVCHRVEVRGIRARSGEVPLRLTVWLDPNKDMLPRRFASAWDIDSPGFRAETATSQEILRPLRYRWETVEFYQVPNPVVGRQSWFPKRAYFYQPWCRQELVVQSATLQASLPVERFRPPTPVGSTVYDKTKGNPAPAIVGGRKALGKQVNAAAQQAASMASPAAADRVDATPSRGVPWSTALFWCSSGLLVATAVLWWRLRA